MRILVVEDDPVAQTILVHALNDLDHEVVLTQNGLDAWSHIETEDFDVVVSDWMMPQLDGVDLCRRIRTLEDRPFTFIILLTSKDTTADLVEGIHAGADDFMTKPFNRDELQARLHAAQRVLNLERALAKKVADLEQALDEVKTLRGLLPICMYCCSIRHTDEAWERIEAYISEHSEVEFTHSICPTCYDDRVKPMLEEFKEEQEEKKRKAS